MKNIMLHAYCADNLGDDLFIRLICRRYPQTLFHTVTEGVYGKGLSALSNLKLHPMKFPDRLRDRLHSRWTARERLAKRCDGLIHIGGSIFIQNNNWEQKFRNYSRLISAAKKRYVIGANFGPYTDEAYLLKYGELFSRMDGICFRDSFSYKLFPHLNNTDWAPDLLFAGEYIPYRKEGSYAVISVMDKGPAYFKQMAALGDFLYGRGYLVVLMGFCTGEGDAAACLKISGMMQGRHRVYCYCGDLEEALRIIGGAALIISARFHGAILGWAMGKPVYPIVYSEKTKHVLADLWPDCAFCTLEEIDSLDFKEAADAITFSGDFTELRARAAKHLKLIEELVL